MTPRAPTENTFTAALHTATSDVVTSVELALTALADQLGQSRITQPVAHVIHAAALDAHRERQQRRTPKHPNAAHRPQQ